MASIITAMISAVTAITVAVIGINGKREMEEGLKREERRAIESRLSMSLMSATVSLAEATALCVEKGKVNGELAAARAEARKAQGDYRAFVTEEAAKALSRR